MQRWIATVVCISAACHAERRAEEPVAEAEPAPTADSRDAAGVRSEASRSVDEPDASAPPPEAGQTRDATAEPLGPSDAPLGDARCPAGILLCEDFEGKTLDPARWTTTLNRGTISIDNQNVARGKGSLQAMLTSPKVQ